MHSPSDGAPSGGKLTIPVPVRRRKSGGDIPTAANVDVDTALSLTLQMGLCAASTCDPPRIMQHHERCSASINDAAPVTHRGWNSGAAHTPTGSAFVAATPGKQCTGTGLLPINHAPTATARRRGSNGGPQPSSKRAAKQARCSELATHEIVGWLLGALVAMRETSNMESVPVMLSSKRGQELDLLRAELTQQLKIKGELPCSGAQLLAQLLKELHAYCGGEGPSPSLGVLSKACNDKSVQLFLLHVKRVIAWRRQWHVEHMQGPDSEGNGTKRRRLSQGSKDPIGLLQQSTSTTVRGRRRNTASREKAATSNEAVKTTTDFQLCEGCGRVASAGVLGLPSSPLCSRCVKSRSPLMWVLAKECLQSLQGPAGLE